MKPARRSCGHLEGDQVLEPLPSLEKACDPSASAWTETMPSARSATFRFASDLDIRHKDRRLTCIFDKDAVDK